MQRHARTTVRGALGLGVSVTEVAGKQTPNGRMWSRDQTLDLMVNVRKSTNAEVHSVTNTAHSIATLCVGLKGGGAGARCPVDTTAALAFGPPPRRIDTLTPPPLPPP